jgi:hypothetical protein
MVIIITNKRILIGLAAEEVTPRRGKLQRHCDPARGCFSTCREDEKK